MLRSAPLFMPGDEAHSEKNCCYNNLRSFTSAYLYRFTRVQGVSEGLHLTIRSTVYQVNFELFVNYKFKCKSGNTMLL